jgi:DNA-binding response OmpR family regulator
MAQQHILIVDDDAAVRTLLRRCFEGAGYSVSEAADGFELKAELGRRNVTLITLDLGLGVENGLDLARQIRQERNIPIIMLTGRGDPIDRVVGLELGADDYLVKPFELRELLARVRAVLRRSEQSPAGSGSRPAALQLCYAFAGWQLDVGRRSITGDSSRSLDLTTAEFNLLLVFVERPQRVLSRDTIMDLLKGQEWSPLDRSIDSLVVRLRKKIEPDPNHPTLVKTVRGIGYVFTARVTRVSGDH